jgi:hypothetical protein
MQVESQRGVGKILTSNCGIKMNAIFPGAEKKAGINLERINMINRRKPGNGEGPVYPFSLSVILSLSKDD